MNKWPRSTVFLQGTQACPSFCLLSCRPDKHQDQEKLWAVKGFGLHVIVHRWGKGKHECGGRNRQRPWRTTGAGVSPPTVVWVLPHWLLTKKMLHRLAYRPIWCREFFNWCFFFFFFFLPGDCSLCHVHQKQRIKKIKWNKTADWHKSQSQTGGAGVARESTAGCWSWGGFGDTSK